MRFYLSSYKIGNESLRLQELTEDGNKKVAYISNALDAVARIKNKIKHEKEDISLLQNLGFVVQKIDLRLYFGKQSLLLDKIKEYDVIRVSGGNCFVLIQAMKLSGFDQVLLSLVKENADILYGGYSAGICVLAPSLRGLDPLSNANRFPYPNSSKVIYNGLGILPFSIVPHYKLNHPEVEYYISHKVLFKVLYDGEVLILT